MVCFSDQKHIVRTEGLSVVVTQILVEMIMEFAHTAAPWKRSNKRRCVVG